MGVNYLFQKLENTKVHTNEELDNYYCEDNTIILYDYRKHYWLEQYLRANAKYGRNYDDFILTKEDIISFIQEIHIALKTNCSNFDKDNFLKKYDIEDELTTVLKDMNNLLNEDFENNTIFFSEL